MSTSADSPDLALVARIKKGFALQAGSELQITYDGTTPPLALFRELAELGWQHAVPAPPPAAAIDWSRPDPVTGTRHSVRPFQALTTATIEGSDAERAAAIDAARVVLARYGALRDGEPLPIAPVPSVPDVAPPTIDGAGAPGPGVAAPGGEGPDVAAPALAGGVRVELVVDDVDAAGVRSAVSSVGRVHGERADVWSTTITYRGHQTDETHPVRRLDVEVAEADWGSLMTELARYRVRSVARAA
jgi:hypothetical protein